MHKNRAIKNKMKEEVTYKTRKQNYLAMLYFFKIKKIFEKGHSQHRIYRKQKESNNEPEQSHNTSERQQDYKITRDKKEA